MWKKNENNKAESKIMENKQAQHFDLMQYSALLSSMLNTNPCIKRVRIRSYSGPHFWRIFPQSYWIRRDMYLSVFSPNAGKCRKNADQNKSEYGLSFTLWMLYWMNCIQEHKSDVNCWFTIANILQPHFSIKRFPLFVDPVNSNELWNQMKFFMSAFMNQ